MSTPNPPPTTAHGLPGAYEENSSDESQTMVLWVVGGTLVLLILLAGLCAACFLGGSLIGGSVTNIFLTPVGK